MGEHIATTRRRLFALGGATVAGGATMALAGCQQSGSTAHATPSVVDFHGTHQAGIVTPQQDRLAFAAYDLTVDGGVGENRDRLRAMLRKWTVAARAMTLGKPVPGVNDNGAAPPADTGEAYGASPANLTITIGFGPSLFDHRFGLAHRRPAALADLPHLAPENLDRARSDGDIAIQACSDDPMVAFHAIRNLARLARGTAVMRWSQLGFGAASSTTGKQETPRNLFGFKDGTRNIHGDRKVEDKWVWAHRADQEWMAGGSYLVARRIQMRIEAWDRDFLTDQQDVFGRQKYSGAPLSGAKEFDTPDFTVTGTDGQPIIPADSHIALAAREHNGGMQLLRRAYNYTDGVLSTGELDAGLFMIIFQRDPRTQFVALQRKLGRHDRLNEYIQHVASGLYACPPGLPDTKHHWGDTLLS